MVAKALNLRCADSAASSACSTSTDTVVRPAASASSARRSPGARGTAPV
ncbi:hypothetical protein [Variovorax paradoxus]